MIYNLSLNAHSYNSQFSTESNKLFVPVKPASVVYAQFDHISGVAAKQGQNGVPVSKMRILNVLIDQLISMKRSAVKEEAHSTNDSDIDKQIQNYQSKIMSIVKQAERNPYILPGASPQSGALFSIAA
ncbi:MAG: hypothetical protein Pg6C_08360 [Treponemataceae bacterium]|nr:MAG: hypothetical protein Pg6C_08360 [Treponemataceae bacterium]